jgi:mycothiol system anti-sigma-R factor
VGDRDVPGDPVAAEDHDKEEIAGFVGCSETIERLYVYLDGELTEQRRIEITRHLDLCGPCVGAYGFEAELRKVIAMRCKDHVPDALIERVAKALENENTRQAN